MECSCVVVVVVLCDVVYVIEHSIFYLLQDCFYIHIVVSKICSKVNQNSEDSLSFIWAVILLNIYIYILWNQHPGTKRKKTWMKDATCRSSTRSLQKAKRIYHGPKIGATNLEAGRVLWPHFWVQNLSPVLGPQDTNRSYSIRATSVLLPPQADSSTYPWYSKGTCPRSFLYHLFEAPVLGPWAHLGFEKKRPQCLNKI